MASKTDADFRDMVVRGQLFRQEIAKECGFATSVLRQNPMVNEALKSLERQLRERGVLPPQDVAADSETKFVFPVVVANPPAPADNARLKRLESENAALRAEIVQLRSQLGRLRVMDDVLCGTGRLPR